MTSNKRYGYSAVEFLFVAAVFLLTLVMVLQIFIYMNKDYKVLASYFASYLKGREAIDRISKDCRVATRVMDSYATYTTTDSSLVLKVPSIDGSRNIIDVNNEFDYIIYRVANNDLWKTVIPGSKSSRLVFDGVIKKSIDSLYIISYGTPLSEIAHKSSITSVTLRVSIAETVLGKEYKITPGTTIKLMNYEWEFVR